MESQEKLNLTLEKINLPQVSSRSYNASILNNKRRLYKKQNQIILQENQDKLQSLKRQKLRNSILNENPKINQSKVALLNKAIGEVYFQNPGYQIKTSMRDKSVTLNSKRQLSPKRSNISLDFVNVPTFSTIAANRNVFCKKTFAENYTLTPTNYHPSIPQRTRFNYNKLPDIHKAIGQQYQLTEKLKQTFAANNSRQSSQKLNQIGRSYFHQPDKLFFNQESFVDQEQENQFERASMERTNQQMFDMTFQQEKTNKNYVDVTNEEIIRQFPIESILSKAILQKRIWTEQYNISKQLLHDLFSEFVSLMIISMEEADKNEEDPLNLIMPVPHTLKMTDYKKKLVAQKSVNFSSINAKNFKIPYKIFEQYGKIAKTSHPAIIDEYLMNAGLDVVKKQSCKIDWELFLSINCHLRLFPPEHLISPKERTNSNFSEEYEKAMGTSQFH